MRVPKKYTRKRYFEKLKGYWAVLKAFSLAKSLSTGNLFFLYDKFKIDGCTNITPLDARKGLIAL